MSSGRWRLSCIVHVLAFAVAVLVNKWTLQEIAFHYPFSLALIHFGVASLVILICVMFVFVCSKLL